MFFVDPPAQSFLDASLRQSFRCRLLLLLHEEEGLTLNYRVSVQFLALDIKSNGGKSKLLIGMSRKVMKVHLILFNQMNLCSM